MSVWKYLITDNRISMHAAYFSPSANVLTPCLAEGGGAGLHSQNPPACEYRTAGRALGRDGGRLQLPQPSESIPDLYSITLTFIELHINYM